MASKTACYYVSETGVLIEKNLRALIQHREGVLPLKSAANPAAQYSKQYTSDSKNIDNIKNIVRGIIEDNNISDDVKMIVELQALTGCRISEALAVDWKCITEQGNIKVPGLKGSDNRYVTSSLFAWKWIKAKRTGMTPGRIYSRFYFYRLYMKRGLYVWYKGDKKRSVTHAFRKIRGNDYYTINKDLKDTQKSLGQKSIRSAEYYAKNK
jgi:integrase